MEEILNMHGSSMQFLNRTLLGESTGYGVFIRYAG